MYLKHVEEGTALRIMEEASTKKEPFTCNAIFYRLENDAMFWAGGLDLYKNIQNLNGNALLSICFFRGANLYTFTGKVKQMKMEGPVPLVLVERASSLAETCRREYDRDQIRVEVKVYGAAPDSLETTNFRKSGPEPDFCSEMFDISAGGMCLLAYERLKSASEPNFLLEFSLEPNSNFLLPARLIRKGNCPQSPQYKYDYGFEFDFKSAPAERERLLMAIFNRKLAEFGLG